MFMPTNGSLGDVMIRLPEAYRTDTEGRESDDIYRINLAIAEAYVRRVAVPLPTATDEKALGSDLDGNGWVFQEVTARLPGRIEATGTLFASASDLANALKRAAAAHGEHEKRDGGRHDEAWPDWYAEYMVAEQSGSTLPA
jgi:hypothetical protein